MVLDVMIMKNLTKNMEFVLKLTHGQEVWDQQLTIAVHVEVVAIHILQLTLQQSQLLLRDLPVPVHQALLLKFKLSNNFS